VWWLGVGGGVWLVGLCRCSGVVGVGGGGHSTTKSILIAPDGELVHRTRLTRECVGEKWMEQPPTM